MAAYASEVKLFGRWSYEGLSLGDIGEKLLPFLLWFRLAVRSARPALSLPPSAFARDAASPATPPCAALEDYVAIKAKDTVYLPHTGACAARFAPRVAQPLCWRGVARLPPRHPRPPPPLLFAAGRYQVKRFRKALCPIVERLCNALMRKGRNNGKKLLAGACAAPPRAAAAAAPRRHALHRPAPPPLPAFCSAHRAAGV